MRGGMRPLHGLVHAAGRAAWRLPMHATCAAARTAQAPAACTLAVCMLTTRPPGSLGSDSLRRPGRAKTPLPNTTILQGDCAARGPTAVPMAAHRALYMQARRSAEGATPARACRRNNTGACAP